MASKAKKAKKMNGYKMAPPIPTGFIIKSSQKKAWQIGKSIGKGGFGEIYSCSPVDGANPTAKTKAVSYPYVVKIEPQENGPLFVEMHFYMKAGKIEDIESWMTSKGLNILGMPCYIGSGSFEFSGEKFRFVVLDRYGEDLWSIFLKNKKLFACSTALQIGLQVIDILEYIHSQGYAHCDVKGTNLLMGIQKGTEGQVYLVDFGLACRYSTDEYKPDPKKAHDGTIEYTSRDAHQGVKTRRGDMEILGFNLLHWTTSTLPWENITDPKQVEEKKKTFMASLSSAAKEQSAPKVILSYLKFVRQLQHDETPDYNFYRKLFREELKRLGAPNDGMVVFPQNNLNKKISQRPAKVPVERTRRAQKKEETSEESGNEENEPQPAVKRQTAAKGKEIRKAKESGPSWKECATVKASNVLRPGEYVSSNPKTAKRQKKD